MVTGFDIWGHDEGLRRHWKGRFAAFAIDALMVFVPILVLLYIFDIADTFTIGLTLSVGFYVFSATTETLTGSSVGKKLLGYSVHSIKGDGLGWRAPLRNLGRLLWFALAPLDFAIGMALSGDPRQTLLDHAAGTVVIHISEAETYDSHVKALRETRPETEPLAEKCVECGGNLILLQDLKYQCEDCGLIQ